MNTPKVSKSGRSKHAKAARVLTADELFFYEHAGYSRDPKTETAEQGRIRCARELAQAEHYGRNLNWEVKWDWDEIGCIGCDCGSADCACASGVAHETLFAHLEDAEGKTLASLGGICDATDSYRRVIEAELASEALADYDRQIETLDGGV